MVDIKNIDSVGPGDEVDGTEHLFGIICTISRIFQSVDFRVQTLEADRPDIKFYPTTCVHQQVNESPEDSFSSSVKRDITATILTGLL